MPCKLDTAARGRHRFSISTRFMQDYGIEAPVSGATQLATVKGRRGVEVYSIGTDQRLHRFSRESTGKWSRTALPWKASSLAAVPQRSGSDKLFFAELSSAAGGEEAGSCAKQKAVTVWELDDSGSELRRRLHGRFATTDPKVYGVRIFALDRGHRIHTLRQTGGGGAHPPRFTGTWRRVDGVRADGSGPAFDRIRALRHGDGEVSLLALDGEDRLWSISLDDAGQGRPEEVGIRAAHVAVAAADDGAEAFAVSRQNQLLWLRKSALRDGWRVEKIGWDASRAEKTRLDVYRTGLTIFDEDHDAVAGVPVRVTAAERMPSTVNGLAYAIGPGEPVLAETNAFGKICVTFELTERKPAPALSFEAESLQH